MAAIVQLLEKTLIRVGNDRIRPGEPLVRPDDAPRRTRTDSGRGPALRVSGQERHQAVGDAVRRRLARIVKRCQELPGQSCFSTSDEQGRRRLVTSSDVNAYLRAAAGGAFTAKDFRTWAGTLQAPSPLAPCRSPSPTQSSASSESSPGSWGTPPRCAARATSTPPSSTPAVTAPCSAASPVRRRPRRGLSARRDDMVLALLVTPLRLAGATRRGPADPTPSVRA